MSSHQQQQTQILQTCQKINDLLQIPQQDFSLEALTHIDWYMTVLQMIYPQLGSKFQAIKRIEDEAQAIDKLLFMLTKEEIIQEDFLEIKGQDIVEGDVESVYYVVQLLNALIEREGEEGEDEEEQEQGQGDEQGEVQQGEDVQDEEQEAAGNGQQQQEEEEQHDDEQSEEDHQHDHSSQQQHYSNDFQQSPTSQHSHPSPHAQPSHPAPITKPPIMNQIPDPHMFKNAFNHYDSQDEPSHQEERHSVLGIQNQFEDDDDQEEEGNEEIEEEQFGGYSNVGKGGSKFSQGMSSSNNNNSGSFGGKDKQKAQLSNSQQMPGQLQSIQKQPHQQQPHQQNQAPLYPSSSTNQANIFSNQFQPKPQPQMQQTGYKMTKPQPQKKQFPSSSQEDVNFYEQPSKKPTTKQQQKHEQSKEDTEEEDDNEYFIQPTIKKHKSEKKPVKTMGSGSKKSTSKKSLLTKYQSPLPAAKHSRKLVSHPTVKKQYRKATNPQAKKLTQEVKAQAASILKKKTKPVQQSTLSAANVTTQQMDRKRKELRVKLADWKGEVQVRNRRKLKTHLIQAKSSNDLGKVLNWRQGQLKKEKQEFQKAMQMKLQTQKQGYVKKINTLLIKLQKEKQHHQRQQYKQQLLHENQQAAKRLGAIEQWYKDRLVMLKEKNMSGKNERTLMHTGHKEILKQIEKELKRENQKQIMAMTMKYRKQEADIETDLEELEREIIKVYKRN